jgi:hypothetical protein
MWSFHMTAITPDGKLTKELIREGTGPMPQDGEKVYVQYTGRIAATGKKFNSSKDSGRPYCFRVGHGEITGWSIGVKTMRLGEIARFTVGPEYGFGEKGLAGAIPPDSTLIIKAKLIDIQEGFDTPEAAVARANEVNQAAGAEFKAGHIFEATGLYLKQLQFLEDFSGDEVLAVQIRTNRNLALMYAKQQLWSQCLTRADFVLMEEQNDLRALVRKVEALLGLEKISDAKLTLSAALRVSNNDPALLALKRQIEEKEREDRKRTDEQYAKMFAKK